MKKILCMLLCLLLFFAAGCAPAEPTPEDPDLPPVSQEGETPQDKDDTQAEEDPPFVSQVDLAALEAEAAAIEASLQNDPLTQAELNEASLKLFELWDGALNTLWGELKTLLGEEEFAALTDAQLKWIEEKEAAVAQAGKDFEGGSIYPLIANTEAAAWTKARVYKLAELLPCPVVGPSFVSLAVPPCGTSPSLRCASSSHPKRFAGFGWDFLFTAAPQRLPLMREVAPHL